MPPYGHADFQHPKQFINVNVLRSWQSATLNCDLRAPAAVYCFPWRLTALTAPRTFSIMLAVHNVAPRVCQMSRPWTAVRLPLRPCTALSGNAARFLAFPAVPGHSRAPAPLRDHCIFYKTGGSLNTEAPPSISLSGNTGSDRKCQVDFQSADLFYGILLKCQLP